ncbi:MAG: type II secretion system protein [Vicinamibacterales bacterium]
MRDIDIRTRRGESGWTLIEMLVVLSLIMILSSLALTQYRNSIVLAKEAALRSDLYLMRDAIDQYYADKAKYPESLDVLVSEHYLRTVPKDPITNATDTWQTVAADSEPGTVSTTTGIYNVKSGSNDVAIDGSRYADF